MCNPGKYNVSQDTFYRTYILKDLSCNHLKTICINSYITQRRWFNDSHLQQLFLFTGFNQLFLFTAFKQLFLFPAFKQLFLFTAFQQLFSLPEKSGQSSACLLAAKLSPSLMQPLCFHRFVSSSSSRLLTSMRTLRDITKTNASSGIIRLDSVWVLLAILARISQSYRDKSLSQTVQPHICYRLNV